MNSKALGDKLKIVWRNKLIRFCLIAFFFLLTLYLLRIPIARGMGNFLVVESEKTKTEVTFVLGGSSRDRGAEAAVLYHEGLTDRIVCTGANVPSVLAVLDTVLTEGQLSKIQVLKSGVPESKVDTMYIGTSTMEEGQAILQFCKSKGLKKVTILSSKFHLRRVNGVFSELFEDSGVEFVLRGAPSQSYSEEVWWQSERGLLVVNNEYVKLLYYWWRY